MLKKTQNTSSQYLRIAAYVTTSADGKLISMVTKLKKCLDPKNAKRTETDKAHFKKEDSFLLKKLWGNQDTTTQSSRTSEEDESKEGEDLEENEPDDLDLTGEDDLEEYEDQYNCDEETLLKHASLFETMKYIPLPSYFGSRENETFTSEDNPKHQVAIFIVPDGLPDRYFIEQMNRRFIIPSLKHERNKLFRKVCKLNDNEKKNKSRPATLNYVDREKNFNRIHTYDGEREQIIALMNDDIQAEFVDIPSNENVDVNIKESYKASDNDNHMMLTKFPAALSHKL